MSDNDMTDYDTVPETAAVNPLPYANTDPNLRFSCLGAAIQMHSAVHGPKESKLVLQTAQEFLDWIVPQTTP